MQRDSSNLIRQLFIEHTSRYNANSIEDFLENKDNVTHYRNGILVTLQGNYSLSIKRAKLKRNIITDINGNSWQDEEFNSRCLLEQFPYENDGLILVTYPFLLSRISSNPTRENIFNPKIHYTQKFNGIYKYCLIDFSKVPLNKEKDKKLKEKLSLCFN